jgi:L-threonylcarbamoyladenylate synthase
VDALPDYLQSLSSDDFPVALMSRKKNNGIDAKRSLEYVVMPDEPNAYAHELYQTLRTLDHAGFKRIIVESVPDHADWGAIRDRLMKASGEKV